MAGLQPSVSSEPKRDNSEDGTVESQLNSGLFAKAVAGLFGLGFGYLAQFAFNVVIARVLPVAEAGRIFQTIAVAMLIGLITRFGMERVAMREVGRSQESGVSPAVRSMIVRSLLVPALAAASIVAALGLLDLPVWMLVFDRDLGSAEKFVLLAAPFLSLCFVLSCLARGIRATFAAGIIQLAGVFGGSCIVLISMLILSGPLTVLQVSVVFAAVSAAWCLVSLVWMLRDRRLRRLRPVSGNASVQTAHWSGIGFLYVITLLSFGLSGADVIAVAILLDEESTALYAVAARLAFSLNIGLAGINTILFSHAARSHALGDADLMRVGVSRTARWSAGISLGMAMVLGLGSPLILQLFGSSYLPAATLLHILLLANVFNASIGGVSVVMQMTGLEKAAAVVLALSLALMLVSFAFLVPRHGLIGAGLSTSVMLTLAPLLMALVVRIRVGFWPTPDRLQTVIFWWVVLAMLMVLQSRLDWPVFASAFVGIIGGSAAMLHTIGLNPLQLLHRNQPMGS